MYQRRNDEGTVLALYLGDYTKQVYLREISRVADIPLKTTQSVAARLEKRKLIRSVVRGKNKYFRLNLDNIETKYYLLQAEQQRTLLFVKKYPACKTFLKQLNTNAVLVVFGSFAKYKATQDSDVDLLIITKDKEKLPLHVLPYRVHDIQMSEESFVKALEKNEPLIKEIEEHHIILNNHSWYVNAMWSYYGKR